ncbi:hypothetical protein CPC16_007591 [Podila verticillata]|nr:hypothetical protein CPC16_007591 [Podila verticillata]KAI9242224.1 MAG: hypothetical protein BYD32DRAFT_253667 [Podila humilis]
MPLTVEQRIRNRSARITGLPQWKSDVTSLPVEAVSLSKSKPFHPVLLELFYQPTPMTPSLQIEQALKVYQDHGSNELTTKDFMFVLETIQDHASSQEQFWESIVTLIRSSSASHRESVKIVTTKGSSPPVDWNQAMASTLSRVYWNQKQEVFFAQILHAKKKDEALEEQFQKQFSSRFEEQGQGHKGDERPRRLFAPFMATHQIMALTMVESLLRKFNASYALDLYARLIELGIHMPGRVMSALVRVAVQSGDGYQLEKIGNLLVSEHQRPSMDRPPLILTAKLMDSFVHGVCEHELYELARDVFNKGLEAGGQYRAHTFTRILNSLSVKDFGFDIVNAAAVAKRGKRKGEKSARPSAPTDLPVASKSRKAIVVADPKEVERYIQWMEQHSIQPTVTTLNVLAKLYLEMAQYKVAEAPSWKSAFRRYNPLGLVPDVVTNNILLAYYERHKDLDTMLKIYNDMAGELEDSVAADGLLRKGRKKKNIIDTVLPVLQDHQEANEEQPKESEPHDQEESQRLTPLQLEQMAEQEELKRLEEHATREQLARQRQKRGRSQRDIYTYNTMLHALLQHAVESKDIAAIGQCFHDMEQDGISADTVTFNTNILYHIASGDLASAVQVFRSMQEDVARGCEASTPTLNEFFVPSKPLKSRPSYAGSSVATPLTPTTPAPDVVSLTSMISGFGQASQMDQATVFFREMTDKFKIEPNLKTYSALVAGLHRTGDHDRAERVWDIVLKEDDLAQQEALERTSLDLGGEEASEGYERHGRNRRRNLTVMERRQIEARRKLFRESLKE